MVGFKLKPSAKVQKLPRKKKPPPAHGNLDGSNWPRDGLSHFIEDVILNAIFVNAVLAIRCQIARFIAGTANMLIQNNVTTGNTAAIVIVVLVNPFVVANMIEYIHAATNRNAPEI